MGIDMEIRFSLEIEPDEKFMIFANNLLRDKSSICEQEKALYKDEDELYGINSLSRFYGKGYERGPFISLYGLCAVLEKLFEEYKIKIYYHGDCSEFDESYVFDLKKRNDLLEYFCKNGEAPYRRSNYNDVD